MPEEFEQVNERKQRRSFQGLKNAVTSILKRGSSPNSETAKTVRTVLKRYKTVVGYLECFCRNI